MEKTSKMLIATAALTIGTTIATHVEQSKTSIQGNTNVKNTKLLLDKEANTLSNQTFITPSITAGAPIKGTNSYQRLAGGFISFNTNNMTLKLTLYPDLLRNWLPEKNLYVKYELLNSEFQSQGSVSATIGGKIDTIGGSWNNKKFSYGDILVFTNGPQISAKIQNGGNPSIFAGDKNSNLKTTYISSSTNSINHYYKITPSGLVALNGIYKTNGQTHYFYNGVVAKGLQTIDGNTYYFNSSTGIPQTGWQTIDGSTYYFNPSTRIAETGWQTIGEKKYYFNLNGAMQKGWQTKNNINWYYLNPITGVMQTGWQTIDGNKYYFSPSTGIMQSGFEKIDGSVYEFSNNGNLIGKVNIAIDGATNKVINLGSQFNPLEGVTLNDIADPTAKIEVSGTVNSNIPGVYKLTYKVTDSYGQTATVTRNVVVKGSKNLLLYKLIYKPLEYCY